VTLLSLFLVIFNLVKQDLDKLGLHKSETEYILIGECDFEYFNEVGQYLDIFNQAFRDLRPLVSVQLQLSYFEGPHFLHKLYIRITLEQS
jgi:hypothetical protein